MGRKLLIAMLALLVGVGFGLQPIFADDDEYREGHKEEYSKGHGHGREHSGHGRGVGMGRHHATTGHLIRGLLRSSEEMGLTEQQVKRLKDIQLDLDRTRIKMEADIKVAEREARALMDDEKSSLSAVEAKLTESAKQQVNLRMAAFKARRSAMAVLTPEQSKRVKMFHERMRKHRSGKKGDHDGMKKHKSRHSMSES